MKILCNAELNINIYYIFIKQAYVTASAIFQRVTPPVGAQCHCFIKQALSWWFTFKSTFHRIEITKHYHIIYFEIYMNMITPSPCCNKVIRNRHTSYILWAIGLLLKELLESYRTHRYTSINIRPTITLNGNFMPTFDSFINTLNQLYSSHKKLNDWNWASYVMSVRLCSRQTKILRRLPLSFCCPGADTTVLSHSFIHINVIIYILVKKSVCITEITK